MTTSQLIILLLQKTLIYAIPLLIVALAGVFSERSGIINLALEGEMIFGGFIGTVFFKIFEKCAFLMVHQQLLFVICILIGGVSGAIFSLLLSYSAIKLKADQTIGGTALNMLAPAIVCTFGLIFFNQEKIVSNPDYIILNPELPGFLQIFFDKMFISTYIVIAIYIAASIWLYKSKIGTHLRACGEHPQAADSVGINVHKMRYLGTTISGFLAGIGGYVYIATCKSATAESSIAGMGFLALGIMIFGNWSPIGIGLGALLFGFLTNLGVLSSNVTFLNNLGLPMYFYNMIPYVIVLLVLVLRRNKSGCPNAEGIPYDKGMR